MRDQRIVNRHIAPGRRHLFDIFGDPGAGRARIIRARRRDLERRVAINRVGVPITGVKQHRRAIGKDEKRGIAAPGVDVVNIQKTRRPGREHRPRFSLNMIPRLPRQGGRMARARGGHRKQQENPCQAGA